MADVRDQEFGATLEAARAGADWAWAKLYEQLAPALLGYARARRVPEPDDLIGEVFLQVVRDLHRFDGGQDAFRAWAFAIAHHRMLDAQRRLARRPVVLMPEMDETGQDTAPAADDVAFAQLSEQAVHQVIDQLTPDYRDVILLRVLSDLTVEQTGAVLGRSPGAVKALQRRALEAVHDAISKDRATVWPLKALNE